MQQREIEELLELIWTLREDRQNNENMVRETVLVNEPDKVITEMLNQNLVTLADGKIFLTATGEKYAETIIRRHRLAERLFNDLFHMEEISYEKEACTWEHVLSEEVTDSVCAFLGHPRVCPHNKPIPRGKCCFKYEKVLRPLVQPLDALPAGSTVRIAYILSSLERRLDKLSHLGIYPGSVVRIKQKHPAMVVASDETTIALDREVGSEIFVLKLKAF